jgi:hypothetical protein
VIERGFYLNNPRPTEKVGRIFKKKRKNEKSPVKGMAVPLAVSSAEGTKKGERMNANAWSKVRPMRVGGVRTTLLSSFTSGGI